MKKNKIIKITLMVIFLIIVLIDLFLGYTYASFSSSRRLGLLIPYYCWDFYKEENYKIPDTPDTNISFSKRYYYEEYDGSFVEDMILIKENVEEIKNNISISFNKLKELDDSIPIEFDLESITPDDYYTIDAIRKYDNELVSRISYYDVDEHILYVISLPNSM